MSSTDQALEAKILTMGLTAPRVTLADLNANIVHTEIVKHISPSGQVLRWAVLTTSSGFAVTGRPSASVSAENDRSAIGEEVAIENAKNELWALMGYALRERLHAADAPALRPNEPAGAVSPMENSADHQLDQLSKG